MHQASPVDTLPRLLADRARIDPAHVCLAHIDTQGEVHVLTAQEWQRRVIEASSGLVDIVGSAHTAIGLRFSADSWLDYAVAWMAVLAAGGVAVPLPDHLSETQRLRIVDHADIRLTIVDSHDGTSRGPGEKTLKCLTPADRPVIRQLQPHEPAQILYTSGTTGLPKGVVVSHGDLVPAHHPRRRPLAHSEAFLHAFPMGSNAGQTMLSQAVVAHAAGWSLARFDGDEVCRLIGRHRIGTLFLVPAMLVDLLDAPSRATTDLSCLRLVGSTAAPLPPSVASALVEAFPTAAIVNTYTTTEAAPTQTTIVVDPLRPHSLGRPSNPADIRITGPRGNPLPPDRVGSVWLRSTGLPRRYHRDEDASRSVFSDGWVRTGDRGRLDGDGNLYLVDREDDIIVSGGFNISSQAVEAVLHEHPVVRAAAVIGVPTRVNGQAVIAVVEPRTTPDLDDIRLFLRGRLARHEVPTRVVVADLPRNAAGKVDKRLLREQLRTTGDAAGGRSTALPGTAAEVALAEIWTDVLGSDQIRADDDFFALGGTSFTAARLAVAASLRWGRDVPAHLAFEYPVLRDQAAWLGSDTAPAKSGSAPTKSGSAPTTDLADAPSSLQEYFLRWMSETDPPRVVSAITVAVEVHEPLDHERLVHATRILCNRHDALRTVFQTCSPTVGRATVVEDPALDVRWMSTVGSDTKAAVDQWIAGQLEEPFDIRHGPLLRLLHAQIEVERHVVVLAVHHLVCDGWSMGILLRDLARLYSAGTDGQSEEVEGSCAQTLTNFSRRQWGVNDPWWVSRLSGAPAEFERVPGRRDANVMVGASIGFTVPTDLVRAMRDTASRIQVSMHAFTAACWSATLARLCTTDDLVLMSPVSGRTEPAHDGVVGCAVQSLLLRVACPPNRTFRTHAREVQRVLSDAQRHQHHKYEMTSRMVPYPAWLRYERWSAPAHLLGLDSNPWPTPRELMFGWPLKAGERDGGVPELALTESPDGSLEGWLVYNAAAFDAEAVLVFGEAFVKACDSAAFLPTSPVASMWDETVIPDERANP